MKDSINIFVTLAPIFTLMGRVIQLDGDNRPKKQIANDEVDVFGANTIEVGLPMTMSIIGIYEVGEPYFGEDDMVSDDALQRVVKARFGLCQQVSSTKIRSQRHVCKKSRQCAEQKPTPAALLASMPILLGNWNALKYV